MQERARQIHPYPPVCDERSEILILGSFPSVKSRENGFFYGHPQNRFWKVLAAVCGEPVPATVEEKKTMLLKHHIAIWDVAASCEIAGSSDSSISQVVPTDIRGLLEACPIRRIYTNGATARKLYDRYQKKQCGRECILLPSTSPANAAWSLERLTDRWKELLEISRK